MKKLILATSILFSSTALYAGPTSGGGLGTVQNVETKFIKTGNEINSVKLYQLSKNPSSTVAEIKASEVEALTTINGDYARPADIRDGFVNFEGATVKEDSIFLDPGSEDYEIRSVIFDNGLRSSTAAYAGGDMGGGGK